MNYMRIYVWSVVIATVLFCASMIPAFGQGRSEDRDNPLRSPLPRLTTIWMGAATSTSISSALVLEN